MTYLIFGKFDLVKIIYDALAIVMVLAVCNLMWFLTRLVLLFFVTCVRVNVSSGTGLPGLSRTNGR